MSKLRTILQYLRNRGIPHAELLDQQQEIIRFGIETEAEVLDIMEYAGKIGSHRKINMWMKIRGLNGTSFFTKTTSLAPEDNIPRKGQNLKIRYSPENPSCIAIIAALS